jgi:predicted glycosyl hydrolase (DUF1957 family)
MRPARPALSAGQQVAPQPIKRSLKKAGVIPNYYPDIEDELTAFEEAGKPIIEKIRKATNSTTGPVITTAEKHAFVDYPRQPAQAGEESGEACPAHMGEACPRV